MTLVKVNNPLSKTFDGMMKELFNEFPAAVNKAVREDVLQFPPVNIVEKITNYQVEIAVPGFEKTDFNIKLEGNILTVSTEKKDTVSETTDKMIRKEFSYRSFKRSFTIDEKIDSEHINATYENGILKLELPKREDLRSGAKEINIQ